MDLAIIILSDVRKANTVWHHLYVEPEIWYKWTCLGNRIIDTENRLEGASGEVGRGVADWQFGVSRGKQRGPTVYTGACIQHSQINLNGKELKKKKKQLHWSCVLTVCSLMIPLECKLLEGKVSISFVYHSYFQTWNNSWHLEDTKEKKIFCWISKDWI